MKQTLLLPLVLLLAFSVAQAQHQVAVYYNHNWEVTKKEKAVYIRLAAVPDSLIQKGLLYKMPFDKAVADYYSSGKVLARGSYNKGQKQGDWLFYYPNGQLQCQGSYKDGKPSGLWKYWRENGQQEQEILYDTASLKYLNYWSESGRRTVKNGTGKFVAILPTNGDGKIQLKGSFLKGDRHGTWRYWLTRDSQRWYTHMEQVYRKGEMVHFITSYKIAFEEGDYLMRDRFDLLSEFPYLERVEKWTVDSSAFTPDYPVLAYMLKLEVKEVQKTSELVSRYQVMLQTASGVDTLQLAAYFPDTMPEFPGGIQAMHDFINEHIQFPAKASRAGLYGTVVLSLNITADGTIEDIKVQKSIGKALDNEAIRVAKLMPSWQPALSNNAPVAAVYLLPVYFKKVQSLSHQRQTLISTTR